MVYTILGFTLYPSWNLRRGLKEFKAMVKTNTPLVFQGEKIRLQWTLEASQGTLPAVIHLEMNGSAGLSLGNHIESIVPEPGVTQGFLEVSGVRIGIYRLDSLRVIAYDPLGLFKFEKSFVSDQIIRVYPPLVKGQPFPLLSKDQDNPTQGISWTKSHQGESLGLRSWRPGDGVKSIHWKQSLHHETLIVKDTGALGMSEVVLILNCFQQDYQGSSISAQGYSTQDLVDWIKTYCFSLIYRTLETGIPINLLSQELGPGMRAQNHQEVRDLLDQLLIQPGASEQPFDQYLATLTIPQGTQLNYHPSTQSTTQPLLPNRDHYTYFLVTPVLNGAMESTLHSLFYKNPELVLVVPDLSHRETIRISQLLGTQGGQVVREPWTLKAENMPEKYAEHTKLNHSDIYPDIHSTSQAKTFSRNQTNNSQEDSSQ
jgi:hypothetical protein